MNGAPRFQVMLRCTVGRSSTATAMAALAVELFSVGVVLIKAGLGAARCDYVISWLTNACCSL